jgi:hypothetical protein
MYLIKVHHIKHNMEPFVHLQYKELKISKPNEVTKKNVHSQLDFSDIFTLNHWFLFFRPVN